MPGPSFRFVCGAAALAGAPGGWAGEMLRDGEIALLPDDGGLDAISDVAHELGLVSIPVIRRELDDDRQQDAVIAYAEPLPLVWVGERFNDAATTWARQRGAMTLLVACAGALAADERRRIDRFVATLGRQSE